MARKKHSAHEETDPVESGIPADQPSPSSPGEPLELNLSEGQRHTILKKEQPGQQPGRMRWEFGADIPTHDFLEEGPLDDTWNLQVAVGDFVSWVEEGQFLTWEAVVCE